MKRLEEERLEEKRLEGQRAGARWVLPRFTRSTPSSLPLFLSSSSLSSSSLSSSSLRGES